MSEPDEDDPPPPPVKLDGRFWALMIFCAACIVGGLAIASLGPRLFPPEAPPARSGSGPPQLSR